MATRISVRGTLPSFIPAKEESITSINTIPLAPNSAVTGKKMHCSRPEISAVNRMPVRRTLLPYFSSIGGPITKKRSIFPAKCSYPACPRTWPNRRTYPSGSVNGDR